MLQFESCINLLDRNLEKIVRAEITCRSGVNGLIKGFSLYIPGPFDSKVHAYGFSIGAVAFFSYKKDVNKR